MKQSSCVRLMCKDLTSHSSCQQTSDIHLINVGASFPVFTKHHAEDFQRRHHLSFLIEQHDDDFFFAMLFVYFPRPKNEKRIPKLRSNNWGHEHCTGKTISSARTVNLFSSKATPVLFIIVSF